MGYSDVMSILRHNQCNRHKLGLSCCLTLCFLLLCVYDVPWWQTLVLTPYQSIPCPPLYLSLFSPPPPFFFAIVFQYLVWIFLRCSCDSEAWLSKCTETGLPDSCVYPAPELCLAAGHEIPELCFRTLKASAVLTQYESVCVLASLAGLLPANTAAGFLSLSHEFTS